MNNEIQFILYHLPDEDGKVQVVIKDETIWATQKAMAQLFGVGIPAISKHLTHIFDEGELDKEVVVSKMEITTQHGAIEGKTQKNETIFYLLTERLKRSTNCLIPNKKSTLTLTRKYAVCLTIKMNEISNQIVS